MAICNPRFLLPPLAATLLAAAVPAQFVFAPPTSSANPSGFAAPSFVRVVNLDGDGYPDLLLSTYWATAIARNTAPASPGFTGNLVAGLGGGKVYGADLNRDGFDDIVLASGVTVAYVLNDGTGGFPGPIGTFTVTANGIRDLVVANLDTDPELEIALTRRTSEGACLDIFDIVPGSPLPTVTLAGTHGSGSVSAYKGMEAVDLDGDGDLDLALVEGQVFHNHTPPLSVPAPAVPPPTSPVFAGGASVPQIWNGSTVTSGDLNGDGSMDLVYTQSTGQYADVAIRAFVARTGCTRSFGFVSESGALVNIPGYFAEVADFDRDGRGEVMFCYYGANAYRLAIHPTDVNGRLSGPLQDVVADAQVGAAADFDGDGDNDIVAALTNEILLLENGIERSTSEVITESPWSPATMAPNFVWVDTLSGSDSPTGSVDQPYKTITAALATAPSGSVVLVRPGYYNCTKGEDDTQPLLLDGVQLIGVSGPGHTFVDQISFECRNGARLSGFTLRATGGLVNTGLVYVHDATVVGNQLFGGSPMDGIVVRAGSHTANVGSNIVHAFRYGIRVEDGSAAAGYPSARLYNNTVVDNTLGIGFGVANAIEIVNNLVVGQSSYGIHRLCNGNHLGSLYIDYNWVYNHGLADNYITTVPIDTVHCDSPIALGPGPHDVIAPWDMNWFTDADADDFHLTGNHGIDMGDPSVSWAEWFPIDIDGDPRSVRNVSLPSWNGLAPDLGADETVAQRLAFRRDATTLYFTTTMSSNCLGVLAFAGSPGLLPGLFNSVALISPSTANFGPMGLGPVWELALPMVPTTIGMRIYLQSLALDFITWNITLTNAVVVTAD